MKKFVIIVFLAIFALSFSVLSSAEVINNGSRGAPNGFILTTKRVLRMSSDLKLSPDQVDKLNKIDSKTPEQNSALDEIQKNKAAIKEEMSRDNPDKTRIEEMKRKIMDNYKILMKYRIHTIIAIKGVLTKDQLTVLKLRFGKSGLKSGINNKQ